jgi:hypothetical protein
MEEIHEQLQMVYSQFPHSIDGVKISGESSDVEDQASSSSQSNGPQK